MCWWSLTTTSTVPVHLHTQKTVPNLPTEGRETSERLNLLLPVSVPLPSRTFNALSEASAGAAATIQWWVRDAGTFASWASGISFKQQKTKTTQGSGAFLFQDGNDKSKSDAVILLGTRPPRPPHSRDAPASKRPPESLIPIVWREPGVWAGTKKKKASPGGSGCTVGSD